MLFRLLTSITYYKRIFFNINLLLSPSALISFIIFAIPYKANGFCEVIQKGAWRKVTVAFHEFS